MSSYKKKENNEKQQWQNPRWILSDAMHERMDSILRDTQRGLDDQDREIFGRVRDTDTRRCDKHKFITESIYHAGALALVCQFAVW